MGRSTSKADTTKITHSGKNDAIEFICMEMRGKIFFTKAGEKKCRIPPFLTSIFPLLQTNRTIKILFLPFLMVMVVS
jgi:hypothetical protein